MSCSNESGRTGMRRRGAGLIEFALGWLVIWLVFSGCYQYGYSFFVYNRLMVAVANAAQLGSKINYDIANPGAYNSALVNMVLYANQTAPASNASPLVPGLISGNIMIILTTDANGIPHDVAVSIVNYTIDGLFGRITLNNKPRAAALYFGQVICSAC